MKTLTISDLQVGKTYRIVDMGDTELGGCELVREDGSFTVSEINDTVQCSKGDAMFRHDVDEEWALFCLNETTTFEEVIKGE